MSSILYDGALCAGTLDISGPNTNLTGTYGLSCTGGSGGTGPGWGTIRLVASAWNGTQGSITGTFTPVSGGAYLVYGGTYTAATLTANIGTSPNPAGYYGTCDAVRPPRLGEARIVNNSGATVHGVWASPSGGGTTWGSPDVVDPIPSSSAVVVYGLAPGLWDFSVRVADSETSYFAYWWDRTVDAGQTLQLSVLASAFTGSFKVTNASGGDITGLYLAPSTTGVWGTNILRTTLPSGYIQEVYDVRPGSYSLSCQFAGGTSVTKTLSVTSLTLSRVQCP